MKWLGAAALAWVGATRDDLLLPYSVQTSAYLHGEFDDPFSTLWHAVDGVFDHRVGTALHVPWLIVLVEVRTGCGRGMDKKYVSSRVIFILAFLMAKGRSHTQHSWRAAPWTISCILGQCLE